MHPAEHASPELSTPTGTASNAGEQFGPTFYIFQFVTNKPIRDGLTGVGHRDASMSYNKLVGTESGQMFLILFI